MKRLHILLIFLVFVATLFAVPAKRGIYKTITLSNGDTVLVTLCGDEHTHYWLGSNGVKYVFNSTNNTFQAIDSAVFVNNVKARLAKFSQSKMAKRSIILHAVSTTQFIGKKKGLVILAQFQDMKFASGHSKSLFTQITNDRNFTSGDGFFGSVKDYFISQSSGQFEIDFDVVGPVTLPNSYTYYGSNDDAGYDMWPGEMVAKACQSVADSVNFADYDWDGDGEVDMVYVLYAGQGEADGGSSNTIWPHESYLAGSDYGRVALIDGVTVNTYACGNELGANGKIEGIGTMCHEFSHCLGLPDMYDVNYGGNYGMGTWDLMDQGNYNGGSFCPAGYTSYEKMFCGWSSPMELSSQGESVSDMRPLSDGGESYIIYNEGDNDEYYLLENRQKVGWDAALPGTGMLILHVDYNPDVWNANIVNSIVGATAGKTGNGHQRCTIFHADNDDDHSYWNYPNHYSKITESTDPYPYLGNDSLTDNSVPSAFTYNANTDGTEMMNKSISRITRNADGTMSFNFTPTSVEMPVDTIFHESFDNCTGTGGNDNLWSGRIASGAFKPDNNGWTAGSGAMYGADQCARFGSGSANGNVTTPIINVNGNAVLSFKTASWIGDASNPTVQVYMNNAFLGIYDLTPGQWMDISIPITGRGACSFTFIPDKRLFLDEVVVVKSNASTGIKGAGVDVNSVVNNRVYDLCGRYLGTNVNVLPKGVYVINGKKVVR